MSKAKVTSKLTELEKRIRKVAASLKQDKFGEQIRNEIVNKVRKDAFRFKTGKRFRKLHPITIESRKRLAKHNKTHPDYSPSKPNLTFTGRLLDSVKARIQAKGSSIVLRINVSGMHAPYKSSLGEIGKSQSNKKIRKELANIGRDPLELSKKANRRLTRIITAIIKERLFKR
tara:strand:- start:300 stop:818 length:519 start_codon:yes stop_codon:yes gene_type:complete